MPEFVLLRQKGDFYSVMINRPARLSVNINKIATLRNARGGSVPDVIRAAVAIQEYGAEGITVHPRPDERHIRRADVYELKNVVSAEFNIEGYPSEDFIRLIQEVRPQQATLVPDPPDVLTSNAGWDTVQHQAFLRDVVSELKSYGVRVSLFIDTDESMIRHAAAAGADRVELYTERYASTYEADRQKAVQPYTQAARIAAECGLGLNAGHDLNLDNLAFFSQNVPGLLEVSIGHALISDALYYGLQNTVQMYLRQLHNQAV